MSELLKKLLSSYSVRFTAAQKEAFCAFVKGYCQDLGLSFAVQNGAKGNNLIIGDLTNASVVITAHYDTPAESRRALISGVSDKFFKKLRYYLNGWLSAATSRRRANKNNSNDNTSGVCCLLELAAELRGGAFVLFDNEEDRLMGSRQFYREYRQALKDKLIVNLDCVGCGGYTGVLHYNKFSGRYAKDIAGFFEGENTFVSCIGGYFATDALNFDKAVTIACFDKVMGDYELSGIHTDSDCSVQYQSIVKIKNALGCYLLALEPKNIYNS